MNRCLRVELQSYQGLPLLQRAVEGRQDSAQRAGPGEVCTLLQGCTRSPLLSLK